MDEDPPAEDSPVTSQQLPGHLHVAHSVDQSDHPSSEPKDNVISPYQPGSDGYGIDYSGHEASANAHPTRVAESEEPLGSYVSGESMYTADVPPSPMGDPEAMGVHAPAQIA